MSQDAVWWWWVLILVVGLFGIAFAFPEHNEGAVIILVILVPIVVMICIVRLVVWFIGRGVRAIEAPDHQPEEERHDDSTRE